MATVTITPTWRRAMERAMREGLKATRCVDGTYRVPSASRRGTTHTVILDDAGRIIHCTGCKGWEQGGRERPCKHAGSVAIARAFERGDHLITPAPSIESRFRRGQMFRTGVGA